MPFSVAQWADTLSEPHNRPTCLTVLADDLRWPGFISRSEREFSVGWTDSRYDMRLISRTGT